MLLLLSFASTAQNIQQSNAKLIGNETVTKESSELNATEDPRATKMTAAKNVSTQPLEGQPVESNEQETSNGTMISNKREIDN